MQIEARFRRRATATENVVDLHVQLLRSLSGIESLWQKDRSPSEILSDLGDGESAVVDISSCLAFEIQGAVSYASRMPAAIMDKAISDDSLVLLFNLDLVDFKKCCCNIFPEVVRRFSPYRAAVITDLDQDLDDFEEIVREAQKLRKDVDGRDSVFRIQTVNYFDNLMCMRAFGIGAADVVRKLKESIFLAEELQSGAFLVIDAEPAVGDRLLTIDSTIRQNLLAL